MNAAAGMNQTWQQRKDAAMPRGFANLHPVYAARAENARLWDVEGRSFLDFTSGISVVNTGHLHPRVVAAARRQLERFSHTCLQVVPYGDAVVLAERINAIAPGMAPKKTLFVTTGAEALENAVKIAKHYTRRSEVIAFCGAFHGRTHFALAMTGKTAPYKQGFGSLGTGVHHALFPMPVHGISAAMALESVSTIFRTALEPSDVAAIVVEPVQGEGGFHPAPVEFLRGLRELCDRHGIVLIVDEVQTGFGRTGRMFASEHYGLEPDLMALAKSLAGGFPLAAVCGKASIMDAPAPGGLGGTYAGSPIAIAAALAVLDTFAEECLLERAGRLGALLRERLEALAARHPRRVAEVRGLGPMLAIELVEDGDVGRPASALTRKVLAAARSRGLLLLSCGMHANVIRLLPPLTIAEDDATAAMDILETALETV